MILAWEICKERPNKAVLGGFNTVLKSIREKTMKGIDASMTSAKIYSEVTRRYDNLSKERKKIFDAKYAEKTYAPLIGDKLATIENYLNAAKLMKTR
jgi:hypothetical protein